MNNTLRTLSTITTPQLKALSLEQLAEAYTEELNPSVLATAFYKTFKLILDISQKYFGFDQSDIASYSLETLDMCLQTYEQDKGAFSTYFTVIFRNRLREESQKLTTHKRKAFLFSSSYEMLVDNGFDVSTTDQQYKETVDEIGSYGLNDKELQYCDYVVQGYTNKEIAQKMNTSIMTLSNIRKKLRVKLLPMCL